MSKKITVEDLRTILYYWKQKQSLERWSGWEKKKWDVKEEYPTIFCTYETILLHEKHLSNAIRAAIESQEDVSNETCSACGQIPEKCLCDREE